MKKNEYLMFSKIINEIVKFIPDDWQLTIEFRRQYVNLQYGIDLEKFVCTMILSAEEASSYGNHLRYDDPEFFDKVKREVEQQVEFTRHWRTSRPA